MNDPNFAFQQWILYTLTTGVNCRHFSHDQRGFSTDIGEYMMHCPTTDCNTKWSKEKADRIIELFTIYEPIAFMSIRILQLFSQHLTMFTDQHSQVLLAVETL